MKSGLFQNIYFIIFCSGLSGCVGTSGSGARTASHVYQPTISSNVEVFVEKPTKPYYVIGTVGSRGGEDASMDALVRAMQKEAAELGAHAIIIWTNQGLNSQAGVQSMQATAIRWQDEKMNTVPIPVTPTSTVPTTPPAEQIVPPESK
jgi:hypothetical protein